VERNCNFPLPLESAATIGAPRRGKTLFQCGRGRKTIPAVGHPGLDHLKAFRINGPNPFVSGKTSSKPVTHGRAAATNNFRTGSARSVRSFGQRMFFGQSQTPRIPSFCRLTKILFPGSRRAADYLVPILVADRSPSEGISENPICVCAHARSQKVGTFSLPPSRGEHVGNAGRKGKRFIRVFLPSRPAPEGDIARYGHRRAGFPPAGPPREATIRKMITPLIFAKRLQALRPSPGENPVLEAETPGFPGRWAGWPVFCGSFASYTNRALQPHGYSRRPKVPFRYRPNLPKQYGKCYFTPTTFAGCCFHQWAPPKKFPRINRGVWSCYVKPWERSGSVPGRATRWK